MRANGVCVCMYGLRRVGGARVVCVVGVGVWRAAPVKRVPCRRCSDAAPACTKACAPPWKEEGRGPFVAGRPAHPCNPPTLASTV